MDSKIVRYQGDGGTLGIWTIDSVEFKTLELPWRNNASGKSCIPAGDYVVVPYESPRHGKTVSIVNEDIGVYQYKQPNARWGILAHYARLLRHLQGCIGMESPEAMAEFMAIIENEDFVNLEIVWGEV